tara:strand:- start:3745 stop:4500 length:756 start_codon:yes stop_codon:yes gene_type:complete
MNKPVIHGTKKHSALRKEAKEEKKRTHGGDPNIIEAASLYGESMDPSVIDFNIKRDKIEWGKKGKDVNINVRDGKVEVETVPTLPPKKLTVNERKADMAKADADAAKRRLEEQAYRDLDIQEMPAQGLQELPASDIEMKLVEPKKLEKREKITTEPPIVTKIGGKETKNFKTNYTKSEQERLVFSEEHNRMVLPEELENKPIIETDKLKGKNKREMKKAQTGDRNKLQDIKYMLAGPSTRAKMREEGYVPK